MAAFTLIELLVVIAIISLLVSMLVPSLRMAKKLAIRAVDAAHQRGFTVASVLYSEEEG